MTAERTKCRAWAATLLALVLLVAACGDDSPPEPATDSSTRSGSPVTVRLLTHGAWATSDGIFDPLRNEGIEVEVITGQDAGALANQVVLDRAAPQADVVYGVDNTFLGRALAADVFAPHDYDVAGIPETLLGATGSQHAGMVVPVDYGDVCVNYDMAWFADHDIEPPATLGDLVDSEYSGLTVVEDPNVSSPGLAFVLATASADPDGWEQYWTQLVENDVLVVDGWTTAWTQEFTAGGGDGDRPIVVSYASSPPADVVYSDPPRDEPRVTALDAGCFRQIEYAGVLRNATHADAGARVVQFLLSERFQTDLPTNMFVFPAVTATPLPDVFERFALRATDPVVLSVSEADAIRDDVLDRWTDIVLS